MKNVAILTDSSAGIPQELIDRFNLHIVPIGIQINHRFYRENEDLSREDFYSQLEVVENITTSQPSPGDFLTAYKQAAERAKEIISIHVTSQGSGTVSVANLVKSRLRTPITVVDSATAGMAQGFIALVAAQAAQLNASKDEILHLIEKAKEQTEVFMAVPTLKYLAKSGRVSAAKSLIASVLSIKPILGVKEGVVDIVEKSRSYHRALDRIIQLVEERFPFEKLQVAVMHSNAPQEASEFKAKIEKQLKEAKVFLAEMGASLAVHGGRGMLGIAAYSGKDLQLEV